MVRLQGTHQIVNIQLHELENETKDLSVECVDREPVNLCHVLHKKDVLLERYPFLTLSTVSFLFITTGGEIVD